MHTDEEIRSRLRDDLRGQAPPPLGTLASDALRAGRRMRRRQRTLRVAGGTAVLAAVVAGAATVSGAFASGSRAASAASGTTPVPGTPIPATWTVPPPAKVTDAVPTTPRAVVAELQLLLSPGAPSSDISGESSPKSSASHELGTVDGDLTVATAEGPAEIKIELTKNEPGTALTTEPDCSPKFACHTRLYDDGTRVIVQHNWVQNQVRTLGAFVWVIRPDGMSALVTVHDQSKWTDGELFTVASNGAWGSLTMDRAFVGQAEASIKGDFRELPA